MGPLYKFGWFGSLYSLQLAVLIGFLFGLVLERAGFGSPRKLVAVFYLRDFAVLKVMFTAIVVCMLGLLYLSVFGWLDLDRVYLLPTYIWAHMLGGLLLGVGFVMGGYCPTTSVVATVSGKLDGLVFILGMISGSVIFAELFPLLQGIYNAGAMGAVRLSGLFHLNSGAIALLVCLVALGAFWIAERVENRFGDPATLPGGSRKSKMSGAILLVLLGLILAIVNPDRFAAERPLQARPHEAVEEAQKTPPRAEESPSFIILEDEGC